MWLVHRQLTAAIPDAESDDEGGLPEQVERREQTRQGMVAMAMQFAAAAPNEFTRFVVQDVNVWIDGDPTQVAAQPPTPQPPIPPPPRLQNKHHRDGSRRSPSLGPFSDEYVIFEETFQKVNNTVDSRPSRKADAASTALMNAVVQVQGPTELSAAARMRRDAPLE